ncbi:hypothetical protein D3C71_2068820 [compost metagenome]
MYSAFCRKAEPMRGRYGSGLIQVPGTGSNAETTEFPVYGELLVLRKLAWDTSQPTATWCALPFQSSARRLPFCCSAWPISR